MSKQLPAIAILAGGLATRLRPITTTVPKSLVPVAGEPFIAHQLRLLAMQGGRDVVLCCGYLGEQIQDYVGDGSRFNLKVSYSFDGDKLKGTGGAIRQALPLLGPEFMVMYGDSYLPTDFVAVYESFKESGQPALMTLFRNENLWDKSNVVFRDGKIVRYDKRNQIPEMHHIDYGLGALRPETFENSSQEDVFDLASLYEQLVERGELAGYEVKERFYEIGSHEGLHETGSLLEVIRSVEAGRAGVSAPHDMDSGR